MIALLALSSATSTTRLPTATAFPSDGSPRRIGGWSQTHTFTPADRPSILNCTWQNFTQKVDHFGDNPGTFPQRVCLYSKWWKSPSNNTFNAPDGAPGPILFYTGNESPVDEYVNNTGLMWELGEQLGALLVFAEHRYEPLSHPALCGLGSQRCFAYCTTAQAIADWVTIIASLRTQHAVRAPVVAFGGSYGGMLAGWFRMKYPDVVDGVIAASAPIWQLAGTVRRETLDMQAVAITRGVSAAGGATDQCRDNLRAAWPLIQQVGRTRRGRQLLSAHVGACHEIGNADDLNRWAQQPYFFMAEGNYPFESTYITYSVVPGKAYPLPAWPMRVACAGGYGGGGLNADFGVKLTGSVADVKYSLALGDIAVDVDWKTGTGNGDKLTEAQINASGVLELAAAVAAAAGVWHNLTKDVKCYNISNGDAATTAAPHPSEHDGHRDPHVVAPPAAAARRLEAAAAANDGVEAPATKAKSCPACPPCDDCPPCPVSFCDYEDDAPCTFTGELSRGFSWGGICCNDALSQIDITGVGRDFFWPPQVPARNSAQFCAIHF